MEPSWSHPESLAYHLCLGQDSKSFKFPYLTHGSAFSKYLEDA